MEDSPQAPAHASVVVVGGGVMGCSTLYHLAKAGVSDAILLERNQLTSGTTWHSAAQVRALRSSRNLTNLIRYSIDLYSSLEKETGQSTGWINKGSVSIATNPDRLTHIRRQESLANLFGVEAYSITPQEARDLWPLMNVDDVIGAVWSPGDGRVGPSDLCAALVKAAKAMGVRTLEDTGVEAILTHDNRIKAVDTTRGRIRCEAVALCSGLWSRENGALGGAQVPLWPCEHFYLLTKPVEAIEGNLPSLSDHDGHLYIRDDSGGLLVGCFEPVGKPISASTIGKDFAFQLLPEDWDHFEPMLINAMHRLPCLEGAEIKTLLNGPESFTPDGAFMLGETAETRGLFLGCGMNSVGVATGGGAGMALAHCVIHGHTPTDLHEADPKRFPDCFNSAAALAARAPEVLGKHYAISYPNQQWFSARALRLTPLHARWVREKAQFAQVYGWERPLYFNASGEPPLTFGRPAWFENVGDEVEQAHSRAAIFDQSTFGKLRVSGRDAEGFLDRVCANNMRRAPGKMIYTAMLNERGGYESDLTTMRLSGDDYRLYVGTDAVKRDLSWLRNHIEAGEKVIVSDETEDFAVLGLMGPEAVRIVERTGATELSSLRYFEHAESSIAGIPVRAARLSYVGEAGWEITCKAEDAIPLFDALFAASARPAGTLAQTSMRIEKGFLSYGHDLDTDVDPLQAGLGFTLDWEAPFIGREALLPLKDQLPERRLVTILLDDAQAVPLGNEPVYHQGQIIGQTTSAAYGYRVGRALALGYLESTAAAHLDGLRVEVDIARRLFDGVVKMGPAFNPHGTRMRGT